ncbi:nucleotidyltransferase domain-containing protein [Streptomyces sp. UNOC14_S4]|uniref:nucleotidyltransferase domain-containing protein n=1 Tax=Streptomyces sp. UNOC14_S4 TaxID=2872340 RepID=UPI001E497ADF|nr:nucleotidyltransferase domain-containing protein [Streptomyces sp. UNOC14_S4]MCC3770875.1 nucleotidyltransferase domain-containing protein [Streptomyces sp. UNOC14_S4]
MKRERATALLEDMLRRLDEGQEWPLCLVDAVYLFGSYARGALEPNDVDVAVGYHRDKEMNARFVSFMVSSGRDPHVDLRQALIGRRRGIQFLWDASEREHLEQEGARMLPLWRRGDSLEQSLSVLRSIEEDPDAGRAPRDDMIEEFEGLDRHIPRAVRHDVIEWRKTGRITVSRLTLPDNQVMPLGRTTAWAIDDRWKADSPLRRAALASLNHLRSLGADLCDIELAGEQLPASTRGELVEPRWWINWKWRHYRAIPHRLADGDGWLEVLDPTRTKPLHALLIRPGAQANLQERSS